MGQTGQLIFPPIDTREYPIISVHIRIYGELRASFVKAQEQLGLSKEDLVRACVKYALASGRLRKEK